MISMNEVKKNLEVLYRYEPPGTLKQTYQVAVDAVDRHMIERGLIRYGGKDRCVCGEPVNSRYKFCPECGQKLRRQK